MATFVKCNEEEKLFVQQFLLENITPLLDGIRETYTEIPTEITEDGVAINFPIGEVYGYALDYVYSVKEVFAELKRKLPDVAINGVVFYYETVSAFTTGYYFHCESTDSELTISEDWQLCIVCDEVVDGEAFYNSSQHDFGEGNRMCLDTPTCALIFVCDTNDSFCYDETLENNSEIESDEEDYIDEDAYEDAIKDFLYKKLMEHMDDYLEDFRKNRTDIEDLADDSNLSEKQSELLGKILEKLD